MDILYIRFSRNVIRMECLFTCHHNFIGGMAVSNCFCTFQLFGFLPGQELKFVKLFGNILMFCNYFVKNHETFDSSFIYKL